MERGRIQGLSKFLGTPIISGTGKATNFNFCTLIHSINRNKGPLKYRKSSRGRTQGLSKFSGHPYIGLIARSSLR